MQGLDGATITLADGTTAGVTLHTFDGTIPQLRRSLDRSLDRESFMTSSIGCGSSAQATTRATFTGAHRPGAAS